MFISALNQCDIALFERNKHGKTLTYRSATYPPKPGGRPVGNPVVPGGGSESQRSAPSGAHARRAGARQNSTSFQRSRHPSTKH